MPTITNKKAAAAAASRTSEAEGALKKLFVDELKDIYGAGKHLPTTEICKEIEKNIKHGHIPVVLISGEADISTIAVPMALSVTFRYPELLVQIKQLLN